MADLSPCGSARRRVLAGLIGWAAAGPMASALASPAAPAALGQPALITPKSLGVALLSVTRAGSRLVAVGERGTVLLSDDHGAKWRQAVVPAQVSLTCVAFADERSGWAAGHLGVILHSDDGGETWRKQFDGVVAAAALLADAQRSGDATAIASARRMVDEGADKPFFDLEFLDARRGFAAGAYGLMFSTTDGGKTWEPLSDRMANPRGLHLYGVRAIDDKRLVVVGEQGLVLRSEDGGASFSAVPSPYKGSFFGLVRTPGGTLVAYGLRGSAYRSTDSGMRWERLESGTSATLSAGVALPQGGFVLISQAGEVLLANRDAAALRRLPDREQVPVSGVAAAADGSLVMASMRGMRRLATLPVG